MALDGRFHGRMSLEELRSRGQRLASVGADVRFVGVKVSVLNFSGPQFINGRLLHSGRRSRSAHRDRRGRAGRAPGTRSGDRISRRVGRRNFGGALRVHGSYSRVNGKLRGVGGIPAQRRGFAFVDGGWIGLQRHRGTSGRRRRFNLFWWRCHFLMATGNNYESAKQCEQSSAMRQSRSQIHANPPETIS